MNTIQLTLDMMKIKKIKEKFKGVFPADLLPKHVKRPALLIANTDTSVQPGTHWVAFYIPIKGSIEYFDSTGVTPQNKFFLKFLKNNGKSIVYNKQRLQGSFSTTCGNYCGVFLYLRSNKVSFKKILKLFNSNFQQNDQKVLEMYKKFFGIKKKIQIGGNPIVCCQTCQPCSL